MRAAVLVTALVTIALPTLASVARAQAVLTGESAAHGLRAYFASKEGLTVTGWRPAPGGVLRLGHGSEPRFDALGNLYFTRVTDDGHRILSTTTLVVEAGTTNPRPLKPGEKPPPYGLPDAAPAFSGVKIVVDAGHGGSDPGATGNGLKEKDINLDIALRLKALLDLDTKDTRGGGDWSVLMTRSTDVYVSLRQRSNAANAFAAKSFLSIHNNAASSKSANGSVTFCYTGQSSKAGGVYRNRLQTELLAAWRLRNRGVKEANFHVLRETKMPAALVEGGFITNTGDATVMANAANRQRLALGLLWATQEHHGFKRYTPSTGGGSKNGTLRGIVFDASVGTSARITQATVALADGTFRSSSTSSGAFTFSLMPGTYRYAVTAPGFAPAELTRTVVANKEVWGSVALRPANVPALVVPPAVGAGSSFTLAMAGDAGSPTFLMIGTRPQLPLFQWSSLGTVWPDPGTALVLGLARVPSSGVLTMRVATTRSPGLRAHLQGLLLAKKAWRLTNGAGVLLK